MGPGGGGLKLKARHKARGRIANKTGGTMSGLPACHKAERKIWKILPIRINRTLSASLEEEKKRALPQVSRLEKYCHPVMVAAHEKERRFLPNIH